MPDVVAFSRRGGGSRNPVATGSAEGELEEGARFRVPVRGMWHLNTRRGMSPRSLRGLRKWNLQERRLPGREGAVSRQWRVPGLLHPHEIDPGCWAGAGWG